MFQNRLLQKTEKLKWVRIEDRQTNWMWKIILSLNKHFDDSKLVTQWVSPFERALIYICFYQFKKMKYFPSIHIDLSFCSTSMFHFIRIFSILKRSTFACYKQKPQLTQQKDVCFLHYTRLDGICFKIWSRSSSGYRLST